MANTLEKIPNFNYLCRNLVKHSKRLFLLSYENEKQFILIFNDIDLSDNEIIYEVNDLIIRKNNELFIKPDDVDIMIKKIYNLYIFKTLSKLVDNGVYDLCWDSDSMNFLWKKK